LLLIKQSIKKVKKMKNKVLIGLTTIAMVAVLYGCGKKPQTEIDATNAAIEAAKTAEADIYIPAEFAAVQDSMTAVMAEVTAQESKLFKKFGPAKLKLESTLAMANQAAANAAVKKEEVKKEVETMITEIQTVIDENKTLITKAPRGKEGAAVLEQIKSEMTTIEGSVGEAQTMYDNGAFMDALNKIKAAKERADSINSELKEAIAKVSARR
jgi:hypothetical protein